MKWLIGITGAFLLIYVILSATLTPAGQTAAATQTGTISDETYAMYTARENDGRIAIFSGETLILQTDTMISHLPKIDRKKLKNGIDLFSDKELKRFLEDYCS